MTILFFSVADSEPDAQSEFPITIVTVAVSVVAMVALVMIAVVVIAVVALVLCSRRSTLDVSKDLRNTRYVFANFYSRLRVCIRMSNSQWV